MTKLYVGNLPFSATEDQVRTMFAEIGPVESLLRVPADLPGDEHRAGEEVGADARLAARAGELSSRVAARCCATAAPTESPSSSSAS